MIKEREDVIVWFSLIFQVLVTCGVFFLMCYFFHKPIHDFYSQTWKCFIPFGLIVVIWSLLIKNTGVCFMIRVQTYKQIAKKFIRLVVFGSIILSVLLFIIGIGETNPLFWFSFAALDFTVLFLVKIIFYEEMKALRTRGYNSRMVLVVADKQSDHFIEYLIKTKDWGYRIWGIVTDSHTIAKMYGATYNILPFDSHFQSVLDNNTIDEVIYCKGKPDYGEIDALMDLCAEVGLVFRVKSTLYNNKNEELRVSRFNNVALQTAFNIPDNYLELKAKRFFDILFSLCVIVCSLPFTIVIASIIYLTDRGSVFFKQERVGLNGRRFDCYKFRSMVTNAEDLLDGLQDQNEQDGPAFKMENDPRITPIGRFIRKTSLDELPQFINVLKGDMSVVGPRPPIPSEVDQYIRWQNRRLSVRPGITCIWQVSGRNKVSFEEWMRMDLEYIDNWSIFLDMKLTLQTIKVMILGDGR